MTIGTSYDPSADVLYVLREGCPIDASREAPNDSGLILNFDPQGAVVGAQLLDAKELPAESWLTHPDLGPVPTDLREAVACWLREKQAALLAS
jgi:hypothetical protein